VFEFAGDFGQPGVVRDAARQRGDHGHRQRDKGEFLLLAAPVLAADASAFTIFRSIVNQTLGIKSFCDSGSITFISSMEPINTKSSPPMCPGNPLRESD